MNQITEKWELILETVRTEYEMSQISFDTWLKPLRPYRKTDQKLYILIPSEQQMAQDYIRKKYLLPIKVAVAEITGEDLDIIFILPNEARKLASEEKAALPQPAAAVQEETPSFYTGSLMLNPNYTFDTFVVGSNNRFAYSASLAVAETPGEVYNPLFIYGGVGLGKTHLIQSIAHFIKETNPSALVRYVSSETFTNELIDAIRNGNSNALTKFREKYRAIDVLLIDDIQFIIGKESTQEEFFHTFNELHTAKKQIIITSDRPPKDMHILEDRIRSRLEWGLTVDVGRPDYETRMAILKKKQDLDHFYLNDDVLQYIAGHITSNIRELEGALNKLQAYHRLENVPITLEIAESELESIISPEKPTEITPEFILQTVCDHFKVSKDEILSAKRSADIAYPRQIIMYLCRQNCNNVPLKNIGELLGNRDHSTVMHGIQKIEKQMETNDATRKTIEILQKKIKPS